MKTVTVYSGISIQSKCGEQLHPLNEVAKAIIILNTSKDEIAYSNSPDFVSAIKYIGEKMGIKVQFYINGINCNSDIEPLFNDFNKAFDLLSEKVK
jgi:hypothetical protein